MGTRLFTAGLVLLNGIGSWNPLLACGDKIVRSGRATRYEQAPRLRQESILIYTNPASDVPAALARIAVDASLRKAGYRPKTVATSDEFESELSQGGWDLVLVGLADAQALSQRAQNNAGILPVALKAGAGLKQAKKQYPVVINKVPASNDDFIRTIDDALASRPKGKAA